MKIILHGVLRTRYGEQFEVHARTAAQAIEMLSEQLPEWPRDLQVEAPGFATEVQLHAETNAAEIHLVPAMFGGGGKFFNIILGAVLMVVGFMVGGPLGMIMMSMGMTMVLNGVMSLFMKAPTLSKSNDPPASKYFGLNDNTAESGTPITLAYGRINLFGHWLSLQSDADNLVVGTFPTSPT